MSTKKRLILVSGILNLVGAITNFIGILILCLLVFSPEYLSIISSADMYFIESLRFVSTIFLFITSIVQIPTGICLIIAGAAKNDKIFAKRRNLYLAGFVLSIISNPLSIASILLYISCAMKDPDQCFTAEGKEMCNQVVNNPTPQIQNSQVMQNALPEIPETQQIDEFQTKVQELKRLKEEGLITDSEYIALFTKLL